MRVAPNLRAALHVVAIFFRQSRCAHAGICQGGTQSVAPEDWQAAAGFAAQGTAELQSGRLSWLDWSRSWLPLGQRTLLEFEANLVDCPEGAVTAILHSLPALEREQGDAATLEAVKLLHHMVGDRPFSTVVEAGPLPWHRNWLLAVASFIRFVYFKWVNVAQNDDSDSSALGATATSAMLQSHYRFLFRHTVSEFLSSGVYDLGITENSVVFSEAFAFISFCRLHDVNLILESGVYKGVSTELWSLFAPDVVAIDIFLTPEARKRLSGRSNVQLLEGDGRRMLPDALEKHSGRVAAVFIHGPKGELAIRLALALREHPQVAFVAMHDMAPYRKELQKLGAFFFSDEPWFQATYGHLDAPYKERPDLEAGGTMAFLPGKRSGAV